LDEVLKGKRQATADATRSATEVALAASLKRRSRAWDDANPELVAGLARVLKKNVCAGAVVDLLHSHVAEEDAKRKVDDKRRATERQAPGEKKVRVEFKRRKERDFLHVRPSCITVERGERTKCADLRVRVCVGHCLQIATCLKEPKDTHVDTAAADDTTSLEAALGRTPTFADELPLVEQAMVDCGHTIEASPIVHPEIAGRGVEHAHGRAAWCCRNKCEGKVGDMEDLFRRACQKKNIPQSLGAKFERRTRCYTRCCRMGVTSKDLEKMRKETKTHRNVKDHHQKFIESGVADDATDVHILNPAAVCDGTPPKGEMLTNGKHRGGHAHLAVNLQLRIFITGKFF
jgi:hypothetical protein